MKRVRYSKYVPDPAGEMSMEDLLSALSDYLLQSGFQNYMFYEMPEGDQNLDALRRAIEQALMDSDLFDEEMRERLRQSKMFSVRSIAGFVRGGRTAPRADERKRPALIAIWRAG